MGPDYKRPATDTPKAYRPAGSDTNAVTGTNSFADLGWWDLSTDEGHALDEREGRAVPFSPVGRRWCFSTG